MAIGFPPKFEQTIAAETLNKETMYIAALESIQHLSWEIVFMRPAEIVAYSKVSLSSWGEEITIQFNETGFSIRSVCSGSQFYDLGKNKKNVTAFLDYFNLQKEYFSAADVAEKWSQLAFHHASKADDGVETIAGDTARTSNRLPLPDRQTGTSKLHNFFAIFLPRPGYVMTPIIFYVNIVVFVLMLTAGVHIMLPDSEQLIQWGANFRPLTMEGGWWRLITACFVHIGILHLLFNMYALLFVGVLLEPYLGTKKFIAAYLITGVAASLASVCWHEFTVSAGASGAIFGLYGVFLALLLTNLLDSTSKKAMLTSIMVFVGYNILNGLKPNSGIDNAGHIGGLLSGMLVGWMFLPSVKSALERERRNAKHDAFNPASDDTLQLSAGNFNKDKKGNLAIVTLIALLVISCVTAFSFISNNSILFRQQMDKFAVLETTALSIYNLPENTPQEKLLETIKESGIKNWKACRKLLHETLELKLPAMLQSRVQLLLKYVDLRERYYNLLYLSISKNSNDFGGKMANYEVEIEEIIEQIKTEPRGK